MKDLTMDRYWLTVRQVRCTDCKDELARMNKYAYEAVFRSPQILVQMLMQFVDCSNIAGIKPIVMRYLIERDMLNVPAALDSFAVVSSKYSTRRGMNLSGTQ